jgi:hypothetical protein
MRRPLLIAIVGAATVAAGAQASTMSARNASARAFSLRWGHGVAVVSARGAILGTLRRGRLVVTIPRGSTAVAAVYGAEYERRLSAHRTLYRGRWLRYRIFDGRWRVGIRGRGVNASAAGRAWFELEGTEGQYSVGGGRYRRWPTVSRTFKLGT